MKLIITGSVGTGKSTIAKALAEKLKYEYINVNDLIKKNKIYDKYNKTFDTYEVDIHKLNKFLIKFLKSKDNLIIDSHLSHYLSSKLIDCCIVCKCELKELKRRLEKRKYSKQKIRENLDAEIFDVCLVEALENKHKVIVIDTTNRKLNSNIKEIPNQLK